MNQAIPEKFILEVKIQEAGEDPRIKIFRTELTTNETDESPGGMWTETFGSREQLQAYLRGLTTVLSMFGYMALLSWDIPSQWTEPSARRWIIPRDGMFEVQDLNSDGEVIEI